MKNSQLFDLQQMISLKHVALAEIDSKLQRELNRKAVIEDLYGSSSLSSTPITSSDSESIMQGSIVSSGTVDSDFLLEEVQRVRNFMSKKEENKILVQGETVNIQKKQSIDEHKSDFIDTKMQGRSRNIHKKNDLQTMSIQSQAVCKDYVLQQFNPQRTIKKQRDKVEYEQIILQRERKRENQLLYQRQAIRQQLIKQDELKQKQRRENIQILFNKTTLKHSQSMFSDIPMFNNDTLKYQRDKQLSSLLRKVRKYKHRGEQILSRTKCLSFI